MGQIQFDHSLGEPHGLQSRPPSFGSGATAAQSAQQYAERTALLNLELTDLAKTRCAASARWRIPVFVQLGFLPLLHKLVEGRGEEGLPCTSPRRSGARGCETAPGADTCQKPGCAERKGRRNISIVNQERMC
jgi:hypothetical protein